MGQYGAHREAGLSDLEFFASMINDGISQLLDGETVNGVFYAAIRDYRDGEVAAAVMPVEWADGPGNSNFWWSPMSETEGPFYYSCPERILDLLSPTSDAAAQHWRELCRSGHPDSPLILHANKAKTTEQGAS